MKAHFVPARIMCLTAAALWSCAKKYRVPITVDSDAHFSTLVGDFPRAQRLLQELDFPEELVVNSSMERLNAYLKEYTDVFKSID